MIAAKHTSGPWFVSDQFGSVGAIKHSGGFVAFPCDPRNVDDAKKPGESWLDMRDRTNPQRAAVAAEKDANARLIAAAPDLLEALQLILQWDDAGLVQTDDLMHKARAAIARATGGAL